MNFSGFSQENITIRPIKLVLELILWYSIFTGLEGKKKRKYSVHKKNTQIKRETSRHVE
ncbi:hypothetical protein YDYSY3_35260 [Paenibacillus chitinolyticus]|uniref:hypothetical protein n=1 Tax=Paenibacillus chitinolyticus TaxID=79263 RepID=UPI0026E4D763|nr:hypothetical protein [Paenibacillus chitinolyticus]GKS12526.1 hypothetical protein YDYSY3_35260 [Paenibacillus chitinolyticus]